MERDISVKWENGWERRRFNMKYKREGRENYKELRGKIEEILKTEEDVMMGWQGKLNEISVTPPMGKADKIIMDKYSIFGVGFLKTLAEFTGLFRCN